MKKTIIIFGSSRSHGDTRQIVNAFIEKTGASLIDLKEKEIAYFDYDFGNLGDDFIPTIEDILAYDQWIFATPVYWYSMSAIMKTFFDRITDVLKKRRDLRLKMKGLSMGSISCGSDGELVEGFEMPFRESADYLGLDYLGNLHSWLEDGGIPSVVLENMEEWISAKIR